MKLGDLFTKLWYCTNTEAGIRPLCTPEDPHAEGVVCGYRYRCSLIPEDFERLAGLELVDAETIRELREKVDYLAGELAKQLCSPESIIKKKGDARNAAADKILADTDMDAGIQQILNNGREGK